jgi:hypothetical protein
MLPHRPRAYDASFDAEISHASTVAGLGLATAMAVSEPAVHHCQICPNCTHQLTGHHCKLVCVQCGYYLSCADYY